VADAAGQEGDGPRHLIVGHVTKPHGTKGEVFVWPLTDRPELTFEPGREVLVGDTEGELGPEIESLVIERTRPFKRGLLVKYEALDDRESVDALAGRYLWLAVDELSELEEGEVFYHQLLGAEVVTADGEPVGTVREVYETMPAHLLEVRSASGRTHLIPFSERIVREVDAAAARIVIDPPAGLLEL